MGGWVGGWVGGGWVGVPWASMSFLTASQDSSMCCIIPYITLASFWEEEEEKRGGKNWVAEVGGGVLFVWVGGWVGKKEAVRMSYCELQLGGWIGGGGR